MPLPRHPAGVRQQAPEHPAVSEDTHRGDEQGAEGTAKPGQRSQVTEIGKHQAAGSDVARVSRKRPRQRAAHQNSGRRNQGEFRAAATAENDSQHQERNTVRQQVLVRTVQQRRPKYPGQSRQVPRPDSVRSKTSAKDKVVQHESPPAKRYQHQNRRKSTQKT